MPRDSQPHAVPAPPADASPARPVADASFYQVLAAEGQDDRCRLRSALVVAAVAHLILFAVNFPEAASEALPAAQKPKVYVIEQHRFKPPEVKPPEPIPRERATTIPIPDPTPDEPEPIRAFDEIADQDVELPSPDWITDIPDAPPPLPQPTVPIAVVGEVTRPVQIAGEDPIYPEIARRARIQGAVIVQATIDQEGRVTDVKLLKDLPMGLGDATVQAVRGWRFKPATLRGKPVAVYYNLTVHFGLN